MEMNAEVAVINVDSCSFFFFFWLSDLTRHLANIGIGVFWLHCAPCVSIQLLVVWIFLRSLDLISYNRWIVSECHKNYFKDWCLMNWQSSFLILTSFCLSEMAILPKRPKPDKFESHNSLKLSFTNIWGLH